MHVEPATKPLQLPDDGHLLSGPRRDYRQGSALPAIRGDMGEPEREVTIVLYLDNSRSVDDPRLFRDIDGCVLYITSHV